MKKIAIIKTVKTYDDSTDYGDYYNSSNTETIITSISDWTVVSDEDYDVLCEARHSMKIGIIERPIDEEIFIADTVEKYLVKAKRVKKEAEEAKRKYEIENAAKIAKNAAKQEARKKNKLKKLSEELGLPIPDLK